jgi:hypothetical protein
MSLWAQICPTVASHGVKGYIIWNSGSSRQGGEMNSSKFCRQYIRMRYSTIWKGGIFAEFTGDLCLLVDFEYNLQVLRPPNALSPDGRVRRSIPPSLHNELPRRSVLSRGVGPTDTDDLRQFLWALRVIPSGFSTSVTSVLDSQFSICVDLKSRRSYHRMGK